MRLTLSLNRDQVDRAERTLRHIKEGLPTATFRALNWTMARIKTRAVKEVRKVSPITATGVRKRMRVYQANKRDLAAMLFIGGRDIPLYLYSARPRKPRRKGQRPPRQGVSAQPSTSGGRKVYPGTFIAKMKSGHIGVFSRMGEGRFPVEEETGPGLAGLMDEAGTMADLIDYGRPLLRDRFEHEINFLLERGR